MQIRRPIAALFTALALFGGGVTMTGCQAAGQDQNDGVTDGEPSEDDQGNLPDNTNQDPDSEDSGDDSTDPD